MSKRTDKITIGNSDSEDSLFVFKVILDSFVEMMESQLDKNTVWQDAVLSDMVNDSDWFDKWCSSLHMTTHSMMYVVAAHTLLKQYSKDRLQDRYQKQLEKG
jgi:hypothetical protein